MRPAERIPSARTRPRPAPARRRPASRPLPPRRRTPPRERRLRLGIGVFLAAAVVVVTLGSSLRGGSSVVASGPIPPRTLLASGPPAAQTLARQGGLELQVPVQQALITAIVYHGVAESRAYDLEPAGRQANAGTLRRLWRRVFGDDASGVRYYVSDGATTAVDIGALAGTPVYAPVTGEVVALVPEVINGVRYGMTVGIQPTDRPSVVVNVEHLTLPVGPHATPRVRVGQHVDALDTQLGTVADLSSVLTNDLRRYVSDSGNSTQIEVDPAPSQAIP